ncbi:MULTISPECIES: thioesterase II family protein [Nocardiopsidaceae]|uniref:Thioesterase domain-containing protein n=1 Tax=Streptomonospora nanhaiensis TaxID=1323731 RepID=A0ABY6YPD5_9ACTN|nr:thioesterase domain-containing protein [Streptomonospora nanhaiensis]WAE74088.1 thioesterase domain-containing protein [Streptomonospora nanhaiensis]
MSAQGTTHASPLVRTRRVGSPEFRLFLLHHAGGAHTAFRGWGRRFPEGWDVCAVEAPGRGRLLHEPFAAGMGPLVDRLAGAVAPLTDVPFGVFGHSMGAAVGYELVRELAGSGTAEAAWLGMSGYPAPGPGADDDPRRLSSDELRARVGGLSGMPAEVLADDALWALFEPRMRADLALVRSWRAAGPPGPQPVPVTVFAGESDPVAGPELVRGWAGAAPRFQGLRCFPGSHFYLNRARDAVIGAITEEVALATAARGAEPVPSRTGAGPPAAGEAAVPAAPGPDRARPS